MRASSSPAADQRSPRWLGLFAGTLLLALSLALGDWLVTRWSPLGWMVGGCAGLCLAAALALACRSAVGSARAARATWGYLAGWPALALLADGVAWAEARAALATYGVFVLFVIGLAWVVWWLENASRRREEQRPAERLPRWLWDPLDARAWYYGRSRKLNQSLGAFVAYSAAFALAGALVAQLRGCRESYELPAGGGKPQAKVQQVKIQKVIRKKFVINPFSAIIFNPPPIDDVKLQLKDLTQHAYKVGQGEGDGAGFAAGAAQGKVRLIRLEYAGGDWNKDFGVGADLNMLIEYNVRTGQKVGERPESRAVAQLANFVGDKSPPLVFMTGQGGVSLSKSEINVLRKYLTDQHGMLFADCGGPHFHYQFLSLMRQVLPQTQPVEIPLDDVIHLRPYPMPQIPYVAPHGGKKALGWKLEGRWVCYYHPGEISDAWKDGHSGVPPEIWELCYRLGVNVIFYAHAEHAKWRAARAKQPRD